MKKNKERIYVVNNNLLTTNIAKEQIQVTQVQTHRSVSAL